MQLTPHLFVFLLKVDKAEHKQARLAKEKSSMVRMREEMDLPASDDDDEEEESRHNNGANICVYIYICICI